MSHPQGQRMAAERTAPWMRLGMVTAGVVLLLLTVLLPWWSLYGGDVELELTAYDVPVLGQGMLLIAVALVLCGAGPPTYAPRVRAVVALGVALSAVTVLVATVSLGGTANAALSVISEEESGIELRLGARLALLDLLLVAAISTAAALQRRRVWSEETAEESATPLSSRRSTVRRDQE